MSITSDLRAQLGDVTDTATGYVEKARENVQSVAGKANDAVNDLRASAEKAINLDAIKSAVEPYLTQAKHYGSTVTDRAESLLAELKKSDPRVAKLIDTAESATETVVATVNARVVKPVRSFAGRTSTPKPAARTASKAAPRPTAKATPKRPATTKPAGRTTAKSATARKSPAKSTPQA